jgi:hypothetical protein
VPWLTIGIKTSFVQKRKLYLDRKNSTNPHVKRYYKCYCNILSNDIIEAKNAIMIIKLKILLSRIKHHGI